MGDFKGRPAAERANDPQLVVRNSSLFITTLYYNIGIALCYIIVSLFIAFRRPFDPVARVGAGFILTASIAFGVPNGWAGIWRHLPVPLQVVLWLPELSRFMIEGIFLSFVVLFPRRMFHSRWPWVLIWRRYFPRCPGESTDVYRDLSARSRLEHSRVAF